MDPKAMALAENDRILNDPEFRSGWIGSGSAQERMNARKAHADLYGYDFNEVNNPINKFFGGGGGGMAPPGGGGPKAFAMAPPPDDNGPTTPKSGIMGGVHPNLNSNQFNPVGGGMSSGVKQRPGWMANIGNAISTFGQMSSGKSWY